MGNEGEPGGDGTQGDGEIEGPSATDGPIRVRLDEPAETLSGGITAAPRQVQRATAKLAETGQDVYHVRARFTESATERDRQAVVAGLEISPPAIEQIDPDVAESDVLEFVTAPRFAVETMVAAIDRCAFVDRVTKRQLQVAPPDDGDAPGSEG